MNNTNKERWTSDPRGLPKEVIFEDRMFTKNGIVMEQEGIRLDGYPVRNKIADGLGFTPNDVGGHLLVGSERSYLSLPLYRQKTGLSLVLARVRYLVQDTGLNILRQLDNLLPDPRGERD